MEVVESTVKPADEQGAVKQFIVAKGEELQTARESALEFPRELPTGIGVMLQNVGGLGTGQRERHFRPADAKKRLSLKQSKKEDPLRTS